MTCFAAIDSLPAGPPRFLGAAAGLLLLAGLWTPLAGTLIALLEAWAILLRAGDRTTAIVLLALGVALALLGPGAWSVDARLFGRRRVRIAKE